MATLWIKCPKCGGSIPITLSGICLRCKLMIYSDGSTTQIDLNLIGVSLLPGEWPMTMTICGEKRNAIVPRED